MLIETSTVTKYLITKLTKLDPITVICDDIGEKQGKIVITCAGQSWTAYWGGMGNRNIVEFFCSCDNQYLISNLAPFLKSTIYDYAGIPKWLKKGLYKLRRELNISKQDARYLLDDIELSAEDGNHWLQTDQGHYIASTIYGSEFWYDLPTKPDPSYVYLSRVVTAVKEALTEVKEKEYL